MTWVVLLGGIVVRVRVAVVVVLLMVAGLKALRVGGRLERIIRPVVVMRVLAAALLAVVALLLVVTLVLVALVAYSLAQHAPGDRGVDGHTLLDLID